MYGMAVMVPVDKAESTGTVEAEAVNMFTGPSVPVSDLDLKPTLLLFFCSKQCTGTKGSEGAPCNNQTN
jgi:hypothetical protein